MENGVKTVVDETMFLRIDQLFHAVMEIRDD